MKEAKKWFVRCAAGGCVIGTCDEDNWGQPFTAKSAKAMADFENERSARRREQKLPGAFDYYVHGVAV